MHGSRRGRWHAAGPVGPVSNTSHWITRFKGRLLTGLGAASVVTLLILSGATWRADAWFYDTVIGANAPSADPRIMVVAIDEKSLAELGRWPLSRRLHAQLLDRLSAAGVRGVGLDILLSEPALFDPEGDALLSQALNRSGKVVLPVYTEAGSNNGSAVELMPIPEFAASAAAIGHVDTSRDADGVARSAFLRAGLGTAHWPSLALALSQLGEQDTVAAPPARPAQPGHRRNGPGPLGARLRGAGSLRRSDDRYRHVSYADVVKGRVPPSQLQGNWVLVGVTAAGMGNESGAPGGPAAHRFRRSRTRPTY